MIALGSAFRNSGENVSRYMDRVAALRCVLPGDPIRVIAAEGDSTDGTRNSLILEAVTRKLDLELLECSHGGKFFGSVESEERFVALSKVGNAIFNAVQDSDDVLVYVESDLIWTPETIRELISLARRQPDGFDVFAPMIMAGELFYDTWAFRGLDGKRFSPWAHLSKDLPSLLEVSSVGSCLVMRGEVARRVRIENGYCLVGWCDEARARGFRIAAVPSLQVRQA